MEVCAMNALKHLVGQQLGALGLAAVFTLAAGLLFLSLAVRPLEQRNRALDDALQGSGDGSAEGTQRARAGTAASQIAAFYAFFKRRERLTDWLGRIHESGRRAGLLLPSADYQPLEDGQHLSLPVTLPLTGTYVQIRGFLKNALDDIPVLSLDHVSFRRAAPNSAQVEADVTFTLYLAKP